MKDGPVVLCPLHRSPLWLLLFLLCLNFWRLRLDLACPGCIKNQLPIMLIYCQPTNRHALMIRAALDISMQCTERTAEARTTFPMAWLIKQRFFLQARLRLKSRLQPAAPRSAITSTSLCCLSASCPVCFWSPRISLKLDLRQKAHPAQLESLGATLAAVSYLAA